jgi:Flp pilus assembly protein TadD
MALRETGRRWHKVCGFSSMLAEASLMTEPTEKKYLVFTATAVGLGHLLAAILGSAFYAYRTGRVFAMDMRESAYFSSDSHNAFFDNFELCVPADLEVITDLAVVDVLKREPDLHFITLSTPLDIDKPFPNKVVMVPCITPGAPFRPASRRPDQVFRINLKAQFAEALARALAAPYWRKRVIGLHYRAAVGELFERMSKVTVPDYNERYQGIKDTYVAIAQRLVEGADPDSYAFMVASDDRDFVSEMKQRLPNAFSIGTFRLDQELLAYLKAAKHDIAVLIDAVTDLWALSRCEQLVHSRSAFTDFAILNSEHLGAENTHHVHRPVFDEILLTLPPETAVEWARAAARKIDVSRMHYSGKHRSLALALERAGQTEEAAYARQRADWHEQASQSPEFDNAGAFVQRAEQREGKHEIALTRARRAAAQMPDNPYLFGGFGGSSLSSLFLSNGLTADAVEAARRAVDLDPRDPFLRDHLGYVLAQAGQGEAAEKAFREAVGMAPDLISFHVNHGDCLVRLNRLPEALAAIQHAYTIDPANVRVLTVLGEILLLLEHYPQAEEAFRKAIGLDESDIGARHRLSIVLERQGQYDQALVLAQALLTRQPENLEFKRRVVNLLSLCGDKAGAEAAIRSTLTTTANDAALHRGLVENLATQGRNEEALQAVQSAILAVPNDAGLLSLHGKLLLAAERYQDAELALREAATLNSDDFSIRYLLSIAFERQGKFDDAILETVATCKIDPRNPNLPKRVLALAHRFARLKA